MSLLPLMVARKGMRRWLLGLFLMLAAPSTALAQVNVEHYIPYQGEEKWFPIQHIGITIHIMLREDGTGGLGPDAFGRSMITNIMNHVNWFYRDAEEPIASVKSALRVPYNHIKDSRIRWQVDTIIWHYSDQDWDFYSETVDSTAGAAPRLNHDKAAQATIRRYQKYVKEGMEPGMIRDSSLHVFFMECGTELNGRGMAEGIGRGNWLYVLGTWHHAMLPGDKPDHWTIGAVLAHELGHFLGLVHPFGYNTLPDVPNLNRGQSNNMMDYWPKAGRWISPMQMGTIWWNLLAGNRDAMNFIRQPTEPQPDVEVLAPEYVLGRRRLYGSVRLGPRAILELEADLILPIGSGIYCSPGAQLRLGAGRAKWTNGQPCPIWNDSGQSLPPEQREVQVLVRQPNIAPVTD